VSTLWEQLPLFGFNQYEAKAYTALVSLGTSNAYQISKESGTPRARIYDTLETLVQRGLALLEETGDGAKSYSPLPADVFFEQAKRTFEESWNQLGEELRSLEKREAKTEVSLTTVRGEENVLSFCRIMIRRAREQVLLSMWGPMYEKLLPEFVEKQKKDAASRESCLMASIRCTDIRPSAKSTPTTQTTPSTFFLPEDYIWHDILVNRLVEAGSQEQLDRWILPEMERFFGRKMLPESYWENREKQ